MVPWNGPKTKVQLKLTSQRCALLQEKKNAMAKKARREIASLVEKGKLETARVKTEGLYNEDIHIELLEIMELYAEMLIVGRLG
jgi:vacuolar protein sorting-associated protein IST1